MFDSLQDPAVLHISGAVEDLDHLYPWLDSAAEYLGVRGSVLHGMHVALEEAAMNIAMHGYGARDADEIQGEIGVRLQVTAGVATLVLEDHGPPFDPSTAALPALPSSLSQAEPGGRGLILLRHFCPDIRYERVDGRNRLTLRFPP